ncbi:uncharacterized protein [Lepisosteus oculatus]|uniref:uncharacterized protein n=1 Tax=Lepisosteus oculatus TaxID=7918 RepID=UPI00073FE391|nr:PREDICTED: uncharacterized protein LOC107078015 [Lepisosteus oculatus]XP_015207852.1 PREDICTED: uncharacterized protein LOC107078015 [Lepisosteus oculatus]XP_015207861.1 PREDICTED: uncharacterized protein LOC107078015 [Lepisosteus oculatus]
MLLWWMLYMFLVVTQVPCSVSQSGQGDGEDGSSDPFITLNSSLTEEMVNDQRRALEYKPDPDGCSINFKTAHRGPCGASGQQVRDWEDELTYLKEILHGNQAIVDSLTQTISSEIGELKYQEVIEESIISIKEDNLNCDKVVKKVLLELETQLEGDEARSLEGVQKVKEDYLIIEEMLHAAETTAKKLESTIQPLYSSLTKQSLKGLSGRN